MKLSSALRRSLSAAAYVAVVGALLAGSGLGVSDLLARRSELASAMEMLELLSGRAPASLPNALPNAPVPAGSPFLEGQTLTIAAAGLQQRVVAAISKAGGSVLSSQVDLTRERSKEGFVGLIVSCDIEQASLQALLYDLEAGMPFLFVEQLNAQTPVSAAVQPNPRLRVTLELAGRWQGSQ